MTSTRRFLSVGKLFIGVLLRWTGQFQSEGCTLARAVALDGQRTAHFPCRQRGAVQAEAVAVLLGGETMGENTIQVFERDANAIVAHGDADAALSVRCADGQFSLAKVRGF